LGRNQINSFFQYLIQSTVSLQTTAYLRCYPHSHLEVEVDRAAAEGNKTIEGVASAANRLGGAGSSSDADDGKGAASQANEAGDTAERDTKEPGQESSGGIFDRLNAVAALDRAGIAIATRNGDCKSNSGESKSEDGREAHVSEMSLKTEYC